MLAWHMLCLFLSSQHWGNFLVIELSRVGWNLYIFALLPGGADMIGEVKWVLSDVWEQHI